MLARPCSEDSPKEVGHLEDEDSIPREIHPLIGVDIVIKRVARSCKHPLPFGISCFKHLSMSEEWLGETLPNFWISGLGGDLA